MQNQRLNQSESHAHQSISFSQTLMQRVSVTPDDGGCQDWLAAQLSALGFTCHAFEQQGVRNLLATIGSGPQTIAFAGHTDVVPTGPREKWRFDPFAAHIEDNKLYGRGAADMKTGIAAMLGAWHQHVGLQRPIRQRFMWLITSDEEGEAEHGSKAIRQWLDDKRIALDKVIIGEPTAHLRSGDTIKVGRRGAVSARLILRGKAGHVAYPQQTRNALHQAANVITALQQLPWDQGSADFPGTTLQITYCNSGDFTDNIVPARCELCFNVRYSHHFELAGLQQLIEDAISAQTDDYELHWERACEPYFTANSHAGGLIHAAEQAIVKTTGCYPMMSTAGGTSDGRFFAGPHTEVVELGVPNHSIHQINEHVALTDIVTLEDIYTELLANLLS